jgi:3-hydroxyethyl bacteriochlorophyllide a dehydrogenase
MPNALAIVLEKPGHVALSQIEITPPGEGDVEVRTRWSGISTGTERLLFAGRMPSFPGMGYPLVPGYESVGTVIRAEPASNLREGQTVFVPGARCFGPVRGLFGGAAARLVSPASRVVPVPEHLGEKAILFALAATALHARKPSPKKGRELIVGHGVLGRLLARLSVAEGGEAPRVWERVSARKRGATGYDVLSPEGDETAKYDTIYDVSGDPDILDTLTARLSPGGEIVLAGFYERPLSFAFPQAFRCEARIRIAAEWREGDLHDVIRHVAEGRLSLDDLITHRAPASDAANAYPVAFDDPNCLKMVLDWSACQ